MNDTISKVDLKALIAGAQREAHDPLLYGGWPAEAVIPGLLISRRYEQHEEQRPIRRGPAPESVFEAVAYALRSGTKALERENVKGYLAMLDVAQLGEMGARVRRHRTYIAAKWTDEAVKKLTAAWRAVRVQIETRRGARPGASNTERGQKMQFTPKGHEQ
jgi:hypothetical protein